MNPDDLVHIADWPRFVRYAREDRSHADNWRPPYVNVDVSATLDKIEGLTDAQIGSFLLLVLEYASCPPLDPSAGPKGLRNMTVKRAKGTLNTRQKHGKKALERLNDAGLIEILPGHRRARQQQTREDLRPRPRPSRASASADAPVEDQDLEIGEGTAAAAGSPASEREIREAVASLPGHDRRSLDVVEPLAKSVPRETFLELVERARKADNPVGWLVARLRAVNREVRIDETTVAATNRASETIERLSPEEALEANVRQLAANGHTWEAVAEHVSAAFGEEHVDTARAIFAGVSEEAA